MKKYWFSAAVLAGVAYATYAYAVPLDVDAAVAAYCSQKQCVIMPIEVAQELIEAAQRKDCLPLKDSI